MIGGTYDIIAEQGSTLEIQFEYLNESDVAIDITSVSNILKFKIQKTSTKTDLFLLEINSDGSGQEGSVSYPNTNAYYGSLTKTGSSVGSFKLTINAESMAEFSLGTYFYYIRMQNGSVVTPLCKGRFSVESRVK
jgi:hypothetical protein